MLTVSIHLPTKLAKLRIKNRAKMHTISRLNHAFSIRLRKYRASGKTGFSPPSFSRDCALRLLVLIHTFHPSSQSAHTGVRTFFLVFSSFFVCFLCVLLCLFSL